YWQVPSVSFDESEKEAKEERENLFEAAYEDVTYRDSTGDDDEGAVVGSRPREEFNLEQDAEQLERRLRFLSTVARLWGVAARAAAGGEGETRRSTGTGNMEGWLETANNNLRQLLALTDALHAYPVPAAEGNYEALVEFDRRRVLKEQLVYTAISTCLDT